MEAILEKAIQLLIFEEYFFLGTLKLKCNAKIFCDKNHPYQRLYIFKTNFFFQFLKIVSIKSSLPILSGYDTTFLSKVRWELIMIIILIKYLINLA